MSYYRVGLVELEKKESLKVLKQKQISLATYIPHITRKLPIYNNKQKPTCLTKQGMKLKFTILILLAISS